MTLPIMKLPCKNCIVLAVCKALRFSYVSQMASQCYLLENYIYKLPQCETENDWLSEKRKRMHIAVQFFTRKKEKL